MQQMNGFALDPDNTCKQIRVEFAKKNSKLRHDRKYYEDVAAGIFAQTRRFVFTVCKFRLLYS
jgi:hypothetical protein